MTNQNQLTNQDTSIQATQSERFLKNVETQFAAEAGAPMAFTDYERTLAQHLFLKVDNVLKDLETKRLSADKPYGTAYEWKNVNMRKMALDSVHRVKLGLDALIPNHVHPVPYFNKREGKYDIDLRVGYVGEAYYKIQNAVDEPIDVIYELVYDTDEFIPIKKSHKNKIESYEFTIKNPFSRGKIIGGFGYIVYENEIKNELVMVTEEDFLKSRKAAQSKTFWDGHPTEMRFKTLVHRVTSKLKIDPKKVNAASYAYVENQNQEDSIRREINENANSEILDIEGGEVEDIMQIDVDEETGEVIEGQATEIIEEPTTQDNGPGW
ncbi:recombinase RecT [Psychrobacillus sp. FSL K6-1267]|uniref:recombinase RecT n=1 Tax=Psychrobacillus sp. FSL K6-1267 TaxID=2921543 RepID=UPI0030F8A3FF